MKNAARFAQSLLKLENAGSTVNLLWTNGQGVNRAVFMEMERLNTQPPTNC
jgi:hypothetical protein